MTSTKVPPAPLTRPLSEVAREIRNYFAMKSMPIPFAAAPYVEVMRYMDTTDLGWRWYDNVTAEGIVALLLASLSTWRGETATRIRTELKAALADHQQRGSIARHPSGQDV